MHKVVYMQLNCVYEYSGCSLKWFSQPSFLIPQGIKANAMHMKKKCN